MNLCGRTLRKFAIALPSAFRALFICMLLCCLQTVMADNHDEVRLDSDTLAALQGNSSAQAPAYNLAGQRVDNGYKGIVIVNGKKLLRK